MGLIEIQGDKETSHFEIIQGKSNSGTSNILRIQRTQVSLIPMS